MHRRQLERRFPRMLGGSAIDCQQQLPAGAGLHPRLWPGRAAISTPTVANQRRGTRAGLAALDVLGGKAAPALLAFRKRGKFPSGERALRRIIMAA